jgi:glycosyltransferase involved in cell wall biosynthesis
MAPLRVSVIVPVFNPGADFDELIESLDRQTLDPQKFEVILCDDGSGEATRHRLVQVARAHSNVRVLTLPHTGWPGTPRNHGIDAARGEYVFFADQDDRLFDGALQQLCDYADLHSSDVVVGKVVGIGRRIPRQIFRRDVPRAVLGEDPLLELLTPHKLFRSSFLRENSIRFPDGRVRLEDHLFVMQAYFNAKTISILASQPCYAWLRTEDSASSSRIDPVTYFPHLEAVLDLVESHTNPGTLRDTLMRHWYRSKILKRLDGRRMVRYPDDYRARFLQVVTPIAQKRFGPAVENGLPFPLRIRSALLRAERHDALLRFAEFEAELECRAEVTSIKWTRSGKLSLTVNVRIVRDGEDALVFDSRVSRTASAPDAELGDMRSSVWRPPKHIGSDVLPRAALDASRDLRSDRVELFLRDGANSAERRIPGRAARDLTPARLTLDPLHTFSRQDSSVGGQIVARVRHAGWTFDTPLRADQVTLDALPRSPLLAGRKCALVRRSDGTLALRRDWPAGHFRDFAARAVRRVFRLARKAVPKRVWARDS